MNSVILWLSTGQPTVYVIPAEFQLITSKISAMRGVQSELTSLEDTVFGASQVASSVMALAVLSVTTTRFCSQVDACLPSCATVSST